MSGIILGMSENCRAQKQYDHRLRLLIQDTRDLDLAVRHAKYLSSRGGLLGLREIGLTRQPFHFYGR